MNFEAIIFDCDGVLIDSEVIANQAERDYFAEFGLDLTTDEFMARYVGLSFKDMVADMQPRVERALPDDLEVVINRLINEAFTGNLKAMPGIESLVQAVSVPIAVASSSSVERLEFTLKLTGLRAWFGEHVYSSSMVIHGKPAPDLFLLAASRLGIAPHKCLVIEDSPLGVTGANAAGMTVYGFVGGSHCKSGRADALIASGAEKVFTRLADLQHELG
ncbi:MAG: HAD family phosphatase [Fimbriimonadaceae bacterium]